MKLYFKKPITDSDKLKFLECFMKKNNNTCHDTLTHVYDLFKRGFIDTTFYENKDVKSFKSLDIWEEKKVIGKFWNDDPKEYTIGFYGGADEEGDHILVDSKGVGHRYSKNFKQITSLEDLE